MHELISNLPYIIVGVFMGGVALAILALCVVNAAGSVRGWMQKRGWLNDEPIEVKAPDTLRPW